MTNNIYQLISTLSIYSNVDENEIIETLCTNPNELNAELIKGVQ